MHSHWGGASPDDSAPCFRWPPSEPATAAALPADVRLASGAPRSLCRSCSSSLLLSRLGPMRALLALRSLLLPRGRSSKPERPSPPPGLRRGPTTPLGGRDPAGRRIPRSRALLAVDTLVGPPLPPLPPPSLAEQSTSPSSLPPLLNVEALVVGELVAAENTRRPSVRAHGRLCVPPPSPPPYPSKGPSSLSAAARSAHTTTAGAAAAKAAALWACTSRHSSQPAARLAESCLAGAYGLTAGPALIAGPPSGRAGPCRAGPSRASLSRPIRPRWVDRDRLRLRAARRPRGARAARVAVERPRGDLPCLGP